MLLEEKYFKLVRMYEEGENIIFQVELLPDCQVYQGHFPGNPICPGVCNIEMLRECVGIYLQNKVYISSIKQCRLTAIATPSICPELDIEVHLEETETGYTVSGKIQDKNTIYLEYKGNMTKKLA